MSISKPISKLFNRDPPLPLMVDDGEKSLGRSPPDWVISPVMYQCTTPPIRSRKAKRVHAEAQRYIKQWRRQSKGARPYVRVKFLGENRRVFIDDFHYHIETKSFPDMIGRYRLVPCVKELLQHTTDEPEATKDGNLVLDGMTPDGERFIVILRPVKKGACLQSFFPV